MHKGLKNSHVVRMFINIETSTHEEGPTISARATMTGEPPIINLDVRENIVKDLRAPDFINSHGFKLRAQLFERRDINDGWYLS
jgi:hypothetical protein